MNTIIRGTIKPPPPKLYCTKCKIKKTKDSFAKNSHYSNGHKTWCRKCESEYQKKYTTKFKTGCWWVDMYIRISIKENRRAGK